jgi:Protein of unknown function (DUF3433)
MTGVPPQSDGTPSTSRAFQPHTPPFSRQFGGMYSGAFASSSDPSFVNSDPSPTGSRAELIAPWHSGGATGGPSATGELVNPDPQTDQQIVGHADEHVDGHADVDGDADEHADEHANQTESPGDPEWKSWKIRYPWMSFLLVVTISLIATIMTLDVISRRNNGFAPLTSAPGFLARDPVIEKAIWQQGILYTSLPAFIMTLYRTMWESTVSAFADRQPYVDLKKKGGRPARATIMLDYKTEPALWAYVLAFRNNHYLLGLCLLSSVLLALLVVPLVAFLFTTSSFPSNTILPVSFLTTFDPTSIISVVPDLRLSLNSAAAIRLQDARNPPWTDGEFAIPRFVPSASVGDGNATIETIAYSADIDCEYLPESAYKKVILPPGTPGFPARSTTIKITANHRGCDIEGDISITTVSEFPDFPGMPSMNPPQNYLTIWSTIGCSADSGWTRISMLTARHVNSSTGITNFSLISCIPSYLMTPGELIATTSM